MQNWFGGVPMSKYYSPARSGGATTTCNHNHNHAVAGWRDHDKDSSYPTTMWLDNFEVKSCCYFISLRTGTKIVGFICLLFSFLASVSCMWNLIELAKEKYNEPLLVLNLIDLIMQIIQIITSVFLLLGAYQEKAKFFPLWLVVVLFATVFALVFIPSTVEELVDTQFGTYTGWLIFSFILFAIDIYGLLVVCSYYRTLTRQGQDNIL